MPLCSWVNQDPYKQQDLPAATLLKIPESTSSPQVSQLKDLSLRPHCQLYLSWSNQGRLPGGGTHYTRHWRMKTTFKGRQQRKPKHMLVPGLGAYQCNRNSALCRVGVLLGDRQTEWPGGCSQLPGLALLPLLQSPRSLSSQQRSVPPDLFCFLSLNQTLSDSFTVSR